MKQNKQLIVDFGSTIGLKCDNFKNKTISNPIHNITA